VDKPAIPPCTMSPWRRRLVGILCLAVSLAVIYAVLLVLEAFKEQAPQTRREQQRLREHDQRLRELQSRRSRATPSSATKPADAQGGARAGTGE